MDLKLVLICSVLLLALLGLLFETARKTLQHVREADHDDDMSKTKQRRERKLHKKIKVKGREEKSKPASGHTLGSIAGTHELEGTDAIDKEDGSHANHVLLGIIWQALNETEGLSEIAREPEDEDTIADVDLSIVHNMYEDIAEMDPGAINILLLNLCIHSSTVVRYLQILQMQARISELETTILEMDLLLLRKRTTKQIYSSAYESIFDLHGQESCVKECMKRTACLQRCPKALETIRPRLRRDLQAISDGKLQPQSSERQLNATQGPASKNVSDGNLIRTAATQSASTSYNKRTIALLIVFLAIIGMFFIAIISELVTSPGHRNTLNVAAYPERC